MSAPKTPRQPPSGKSRDKRLADALRQNLLRRKEQQRGRAPKEKK